MEDEPAEERIDETMTSAGTRAETSDNSARIGAVKPSSFVYHRPTTVEEALDVLAEVGSDGKVLAGGQSLVPLMSMRLAAPAHLVDVNQIGGLDGIQH